MMKIRKALETFESSLSNPRAHYGPNGEPPTKDASAEVEDARAKLMAQIERLNMQRNEAVAALHRARQIVHLAVTEVDTVLKESCHEEPK